VGCVHLVRSLHYATRTAALIQTPLYVTGYSFHESSQLKLNVARIVNRSVMRPSLG